MSLSDLKKKFDTSLQTALKITSKEERLKALKTLQGEMRMCQGKVVHRPYSQPDDRYEDMANDYGDFLDDHYTKCINICGKEIGKIEQEMHMSK